MREKVRKVLIEIQQLLKKNQSIREEDIQPIIIKNNLNIVEVNELYSILDELDILPIKEKLDEDDDKEPTISDLETIDILDDEDSLNIEEIDNKKRNKKNGLVEDLVRAYLLEIGKKELLSPRKEKKLTKELYELRQLLSTLDPNSIEYQNISDKYIKAKNNFAEHNLRLVVSIAKHYMGRGMELLDMIQEGNIGLERAIEKFDYTKGFKFSTYATWWIRQAITRAISEQMTTIRVPVHIREKINKLNRITEELIIKLHRKPTNNEILPLMYPDFIERLEKKLGRKPTIREANKEIRRCSKELYYLQIVNKNIDCASLDLPIIDGENDSLIDFIADEKAKNAEEEAMQDNLRHNIKNILDDLTVRERITVMMRYGLYDGIIKEEEREALATKMVLNMLPKVIKDYLEELNTEANELNDIEPVNFSSVRPTRYSHYLDEQPLLIDYYKSKDPNYYKNSKNKNYETAIKTVASYNSIAASGGKPKTKKVKVINNLDNNLNINTYLYLKENYKDLYERAYITLTHGSTSTLEEIGRLFGVTRERTRQVQVEAISKIQTPKRRRLIRDYAEERKRLI